MYILFRIFLTEFTWNKYFIIIDVFMVTFGQFNASLLNEKFDDSGCIKTHQDPPMSKVKSRLCLGACTTQIPTLALLGWKTQVPVIQLSEQVIDGWTDRYMDGWTDDWVDSRSCLPNCVQNVVEKRRQEE